MRFVILYTSKYADEASFYEDKENESLEDYSESSLNLNKKLNNLCFLLFKKYKK